MTEEKQQVIKFGINDKRIAEIAENFKGIDAHQDYKAAKSAKKVLVKMRSTLSEAHKDQKADALAFGRRLDAEKNRLLDLIGAVENPITAGIKEVDDAEKIKEEARIGCIQAEIEAIRWKGQDLDGLNSVDLKLIQADLASIEPTEEVFQEFLVDANGAKAESESRVRIALNRAITKEEEEERLEKQRKEQEERQAELDAQQKAMDEKAAEQRKEQEQRDRNARAEQEEADRIRREDLDREAARQKEAQDKIDTENKRITDEREKKEKEEADAAEAEAARILAEQQAPDAEKFAIYANSLDHLIRCTPPMDSERGKEIINHCRESLQKISNRLKQYAEEMK